MEHSATHLGALVALLDSIPTDAWACGPTAAALHRFDGFALRPPFHVLVERGHNLQRVGHAIHTTLDLPPLDRERVDGIAVVAPTRTLVEIARTTPDDRLTIALDGAIRDGLTCDDFLHRRIADLRTRGRYGIPKLLRAIEGHEVTRGGQSWLEREFLRLVTAAGLPKPATQQVLGRRAPHTMIRVDFRFPGTRLVVETMGYRFHRTPSQASIDAARVNRLLLDGWTVLQFTYRQVVDEPASVIATVVEALAQAAAA
jgi:very-short-patch-repair endonuclease